MPPGGAVPPDQSMRSALAIGITAVLHAMNQDDTVIIVQLVDDSIVTSST